MPGPSTVLPARGGVLMQLDVMKDDADNPRDIKPENLLGLGDSMHDFGDLSGIVWNRTTGELVCGHQRVDRLRAAGATDWVDLGGGIGFIVHPETKEEFVVRIVEWDRAKQRIANVVANNPHLQGSFTRAVAAQLEGLDDRVARERLRLDALLKQHQQPERERRTLEDFEHAPPPKRAWVLVATTEDIAAAIEADLRAAYAGQDVRVEASHG